MGLSHRPGTVPGTLGLSQRPRVPTPWSIFLNLRDLKAWDSPGMLGLSRHHGVFFLNSETQKPGTVPGLWDLSQKPRTLGLSQRPRVPTPWSIFLNFRDSPGTLGLSKDPEFPHRGVYFSIAKAWDFRTVPEARTVLGQSQF